MAFAIAAARSYLFSSPISSSLLFRDIARPFASLSTRHFSAGIDNGSDTADLRDWCARKKIIAPNSKYLRYKKPRGLFVSKLADTEWCRKQKKLILQGRSNKSTTESRKAGPNCDKEKEKEIMKITDDNGRSAVNDRAIKLAQFINGARHSLFNGLRHQLWVEEQLGTEAMKAGTARHKELANEVVQRIEGKCESEEDTWALNFVNIIVNVNHLLYKGLTRELRVIAFVRGVWITGFIDEIRLSEGEKPKLVDTKTRVTNSLPSEEDKSSGSGRLQLMIYKFLWDKLVSEEFPLEEFCAFYQLDPDKFLSEEIRTRIADAGVPAQNLGEVVRCMEDRCKMLLPADDKMILRYEWQKNKSLIKEVEFEFDPVWFKIKMEHNLGFWVRGKKKGSRGRKERRRETVKKECRKSKRRD